MGGYVKMSNVLEILLSHKTSEGTWIYFEKEENPLLGSNCYATYCGNSVDNRYWGHYCFTYENGLVDYANRVKRGY